MLEYINNIKENVLKFESNFRNNIFLKIYTIYILIRLHLL